MIVPLRASGEDKIEQKVQNAEIVPFRGRVVQQGDGEEQHGGGNGAPDVCPVTALGTLEGFYYFISPDGELRKLAARDFTEKTLVSLFAGDSFWLRQTYPASTRKGGKDHSRFDTSDAIEGLILACHKRGLFNPHAPVRGPGVWRALDLPILHTGDALWYRNQWLPPGQLLHNAIYTARAKLERPDFSKPLPIIETRELRQWLGAWSFNDAADIDLLFGFVGAALLGGFPSWRAHMFAIGERGCGKSTLGEYIMACLGAQGLSLNDYTEAGLRQLLVNEARAIWLDEGEPSTDGSSQRMAQVIRLLRILSGGQGARIARGSSDGTAQSYTVTGCVMLTAINPPPLEPQDRSRIVQVSLTQPHTRGTSAQDLLYFIEEAKRRSAQLRARAILGVDRFVGAVQLYRNLLMQKGCDGRQADLFATLLAGHSLLLHDALPSEEQAMDLVRMLDARLGIIFVEDSESGDGQLCLSHLFDYLCDVVRDGRRLTLGQLIVKQVQSMRGMSSVDDDLLETYGMRLLSDGKLFVPHTHGQLARIFANTKWAAGGWRHSLQRLPGVYAAPHPVRVGGRDKIRGLLVPADLLPSPETFRPP